MDRKYLDALHELLADLESMRNTQEHSLIADEHVPGEEELIQWLAEDPGIQQLDKRIDKVNEMIDKAREEEKERLRMAAHLLESWLAGRALYYTDSVLTDEVLSVAGYWERNQ